MPLAVSRSSFVSTRLVGGSSTLARGASGSAVSELQRLLQTAGVPCGPVDGDFGPMTQAGVKRFQAANGLAADGVVGPATWSALRRAASSGAPSTGDAGSVLRSGDFGAEVEQAQRLLEKHGFDVGGADGQFGPMTRSAVVQFQRAKGLSADGVVGPATWKALNGPVEARPVPPPVSGDMRQRVLDAARAELGTLESGNNGGAALKYPRFFGRGSEAWCADFVSYVMNQSGGRMNDPYCPSIVNRLKEQGTWKRSNPQPGDMVLFDWDRDGTADHIGIVERVNANGTISTIEGNTTDPNSGREGVFRRERSTSTVLGYGAPF